MTSDPFGRALRYGGDYNPEQWPREVWEDDVKLMRDAGVNLVTVGVFSWSNLEPREGVFDFAWLRDVLDLLADAGIGVDLATPTASPPPWFGTHYADAMPVDERGARYWQGSRQHFCVCHPEYQRLATRIVEQLVAAVGDHRAIEMWHLHNEYACHVPYCYCDHHAAAFRSWLGARYETIERLNASWGTAFWSQRYAEFSEVLPPRRTPTTVNPSQELDYRRFSNDAFLEVMRMERAIVRERRGDVPVTTNFMGFFKPLDYFAWAAELDVVSTDNYQDPADPRYPVVSAMHYDLVRSLNKDAPWLVMEQVSSRVNWRERNAMKVPGAMRALSYQAIARGAEGVLFFQWRASRAGGEKFHGAMVGHAGTETPSWQEVAHLGQELAALGSLGAKRVRSSVAMIHSWPSWWALEAPGKPANDFHQLEQTLWMYAPLFGGASTVDFCHPAEALGPYDAVLVPSAYLLREDEGANLAAYVEGGGTAVISFWSGIVDEHDQVYLGPYGGPIRHLFGGRVVDVAPLAAGSSVELEWSDGSRSSGEFWLDIVAEDDAEVLARVASGPYAGRPAVLRSRRGAGEVLYVGTRLDAAGIEKVYRGAAALAPYVPESATLLERTARRDATGRVEFVINHGPHPATVELAAGAVDAFSGSAVGSPLALAPQGVAVVRYE